MPPRSPRLSRTGAALAALLVVLAVAGPWLAPADPRRQLDPPAGRLLPPGSARWAVETPGGWLLADAVEPRPEGLRFHRLGEWRERPATGSGQGLDRVRFPLGTDRYGRDVLSRLLHGGRVSLAVAGGAVALGLLLGVLVGAASGLGGRRLDALLMRTGDAFLAFPRLFLVLAAAALWRSGTLAVVVLLAATGWMEPARLLRGELLRLRRSEFVLAARAAGLSQWRLLAGHLLPFALPPLLVHSALRVGDTLLVEAALSYLGFGVQPPVPSWGNLVAEAQDHLLAAPWLAVFPGLTILLAVLAANLLAEAADPE